MQRGVKNSPPRFTLWAGPRNAQASPRFLLALAALFLIPALLIAQGPAWWGPMNVIDPNATANDYAAINQGQLKNMAVQAYTYLQTNLPAATWTTHKASPSPTSSIPSKPTPPAPITTKPSTSANSKPSPRPSTTSSTPSATQTPPLPPPIHGATPPIPPTTTPWPTSARPKTSSPLILTSLKQHQAMFVFGIRMDKSVLAGILQSE